MSVSYLIEFAVLSVERERFLILLNGVLDMMRGEKMFVNATLHADSKDENRFLLNETWSDHDDVLDVQLHKDGHPHQRARASDGGAKADPSVIMAARGVIFS